MQVDFRTRVVVAALLLGVPCGAQAQQAGALRATQLPDNGPRPTIDGKVDDEVWRSIAPFTDFTQQEPTPGQPATEKTEVRIAFDRANVYVAIVALDSLPDQIVTTQTRRDADLSNADSVQVIFDTFNDNQSGFIFGTDPRGLEYDAQVAGEGQTGSVNTNAQSGQGGSQRGSVSALNTNWDGDWSVRSQITERGWETEMVIPLRTLRYNPGRDRTWGFNVMRNIRRHNEQVFLAAIPRGYTIARLSQAAKLSGMSLPARRDIKAIPYVAARADKDFTAVSDQLDRQADVGLDVKWGVTPSLTFDATVNTDFAQVEADDEQINLTRFPLFFPEKRGFFLENANIFQFGIAQTVDLFFSRRIGLSSSGVPFDLLGGGRLSGKAGKFNVGLLNMQTRDSLDARNNDRLIAPANNFSVARVQREYGRSNIGAIFVGRAATSDRGGSENWNRSYGLDSAIQTSNNGKLFLMMARTDSPTKNGGSDYAGRATYTYTNPLINGHVQYAQVGERFNPDVGFLPRRGFREVEGRMFFTYKPKSPSRQWIRAFSPHVSQNAYFGFDNQIQTSRGHYHFFEIQPSVGGRFGMQMDHQQDRPIVPFTVFSSPNGRRVVIPPNLYGWNVWQVQYFGNASAPFYYNISYGWGGFYDGSTKQFLSTVGMRLGSRFSGSISWNRDNIQLPGGNFHTNLIPVRLGYSFTPLATVNALLQYNSQTSQFSSNVRLAMLNRSGTGLFFVYNDRRELADSTEIETLGRSFIVKYTRLFTF
jgi:hypothetical protein